MPDLVKGLGDVEENCDCLLAVWVESIEDEFYDTVDLLGARVFGAEAELVGNDNIITDKVIFHAGVNYSFEEFAHRLEEANGAMTRGGIERFTRLWNAYDYCFLPSVWKVA